MPRIACAEAVASMTLGRTAGVIGWPVGHSRSPLIHGHWLRTHGIAGAYVALPVAPGRLPDAMRGLAALGFAGANVTLPHKEEAARLADLLTHAATRIGAANLLCVTETGILADNTDGFGFLASLHESAPGWDGLPGPAVVLGAGGAARAIVAALLDTPTLTGGVRLLNRSRARAEALSALGDVAVHDWDARDAALDGACLLVNTTTLGMAGQPPLLLSLHALPRHAVVCDIVYVPQETPLLIEARARGNRVVRGLGMLLHQARPAFEAWFGVRPSVTAALRSEVEATL